MSADKNQTHKNNHSLLDIDLELKESSNMRHPLLSFQSNDEDDDDGDDGDDGGKNKVIEKIFTVTEIVDTIMKASHDVSLRYINRDELIKIISKIHNHQQRAFSSNDFIIFKKYEDYCDENEDSEKRKLNHECKYDYGVFKHRQMDLIFRIDSIDDQVDNENNVRRILLKKYNNNYKDVMQMGIVLPIHIHIQNTSKLPLFPLYYSIQPYINGITLDCWIEINIKEILLKLFMIYLYSCVQ